MNKDVSILHLPQWLSGLPNRSFVYSRINLKNANYSSKAQFWQTCSNNTETGSTIYVNRIVGIELLMQKFVIRTEFFVPSPGGELISSLINLVTSLSNTTVSKAQPLCARVISCLIAVRKPCGLKNPVIQKTFGRPSNSQLVN